MSRPESRSSHASPIHHVGLNGADCATEGHVAQGVQDVIRTHGLPVVLQAVFRDPRMRDALFQLGLDPDQLLNDLGNRFNLS